MLKVQTVSHGFPPEPFEYTKSSCVVCAKHSTLHLLKTSWGSVWGIASLLCRSPSSPLLSVCTQDGTFSDLLLEPHKFSRQFTRVPGCHERGPAAVPGTRKKQQQPHNLVPQMKTDKLIQFFSIFFANAGGNKRVSSAVTTGGFCSRTVSGGSVCLISSCSGPTDASPILTPSVRVWFRSGGNARVIETRVQDITLSLSHTETHTHTPLHNNRERFAPARLTVFVFFLHLPKRLFHMSECSSRQTRESIKKRDCPHFQYLYQSSRLVVEDVKWRWWLPTISNQIIR